MKRMIKVFPILLIAIVIFFPGVVSANSLKFDKKTIKCNLAKGCKLKLVPVDSKKYVWKTSDKKIAVVSKKGIVRAKKEGLVTIKAVSGKKIYKCNLTVTNPVLSATEVYQTIGKEYSLSVRQSSGAVRWQSENTAVATVDSLGKIKTVDYGETNIRATVDGKVLKCKFTTEPIPSLSSLYYMSGIKSYASSSSIAKISEIKDNYNMLDVKDVGDITMYKFDDDDTIPVFDTHPYSVNNNAKGERYTNIYLVGTSQKAKVWVENDLTNKNNNYTKPRCLYTPKDGYGIITIYAPNGPGWVYNIKIGDYTYKFGTRSRTYDKKYASDWREDELSQSTLNEYSYILAFKYKVDDFLQACEFKLIEILVDIL